MSVMGITPMFSVSDSPFDVRCDFCDELIYGKPVEYDDFQICCQCFDEEPRCEYCEGDGPLRTYEWDNYDRETGRDIGEMRVCRECLDRFTERRTA